MADYTQTITNSFQVFAPGPTSEWGSMEWGTDDWGGGDDQKAEVHKFLADSLTLTDVWSNVATWNVIVLNELAGITSDVPDITQVDADGYYHVFRSDTTDAADRATTTYTEEATSGTSWTAASDSSTIWS